jgi:CelD/BcsL family acetyltransferase involved in cellulose biosynthesis
MASLSWVEIRDDAGFESLAAGWRHLAATMAEPSLFATYEWNRTWWTCFGHGRRLHIVGAMRDGQLVAVAPLCTSRRLGGVRVREFLGSEEADQGRLLLAAGHEDLGGELARVALQDAAWDLLDLWCVPAGTASATALGGSLRASGAGYRVAPLTTNPVLSLLDDAWKEGERREHLGRKRRGLERQGRLSLVFPEDRAGVERALEEFRALHVKRWATAGEVSRLTVPSYWAWVRSLTLEAFRLGWLRLPSLVLDGTVVATGLFFLHRRRLFQWMNAHDLSLARHSPFLLLIQSTIQHALARGEADLIDFGRGDEWYKSRWTRTAVPLERFMAWRRLRGRGAYLWRGRVRPWAWAHPGWSRPIRRLKRSLHRLAPGVA